MLTNDVINGRMVRAGEEVGEKVDHHEALLLALQRENIE